MMRRLLSSLLLLVGCGLPLDQDQRVPTFPLYDPGASEIPMPNDALRDGELGRLDLPVDDETLSPADLDFRTWLNTRDGWATTLPATVRFSGPVDSATVDADHVQVWDWNGGAPFRFEDAQLRLDEDDRRLSIIPPRTGWERGHQYIVVLQGGAAGIRDAAGFGLEPDAAFWFLRRTSRLDTVGHNRAFPGATREERLQNGRDLEALRQELAPFFEFFEDPARPTESELPRDEVAALWSFTVTRDPELAMDRDSQRIPLPFDLLIDPDTGLVELEEAPWDTDLERDAKRQAGELDGFAVSANLLFELTEAVDPASVGGRVHLFSLTPAFQEIATTVRVMGDGGEAACQVSPTPSDCVHLVIEIDDASLPLPPASTFVVVVDRGLLAASGEPIEVMPIGHFMRTPHPLAIDGVSQVSSLSDELATRLEGPRASIAEFLGVYGREAVLTAWPFTTMNAVPGVRSAARTTIELDLDIEPTVRERLEPLEALEALFPGFAGLAFRAIYLARTEGVAEFVIGELPSPYFLDPQTRRWRQDGQYELEPVRFYLSIPEGADPSAPLPVVVFGHAIVTDARFMMAVAGEMAQRGFATLTIDFPFHGERIDCIDASLVAIPNFLPDAVRGLSSELEDDLLRFPPCASGPDATCGPDGQCVTAGGAPDEFFELPIVAVQSASGAAFLDVGDLPHINEHFSQALVDLSTVLHAIQSSDWRSAVGYALDPDRVHYAGQSLGAIIGAVWVSVTPEIRSAVLNVPGADLVDLFRESTFFAPQIDVYFDDIGVAQPSFEQERLLNVARWLIDSVDPHSVAHRYREDDRRVLLQMDEGDIIIPNRTTEVLRRVSGRPMRTYPVFLHADLVIPLIGDPALRDMGQFLSGEIDE